METERIALSPRERDRFEVLHEVQQNHLSQAADTAVQMRRPSVCLSSIPTYPKCRNGASEELGLIREIAFTYSQNISASCFSSWPWPIEPSLPYSQVPFSPPG